MPMNKDSPTKSQGITLNGSIWLTAGGESLGGRGRIELLTKVVECGSITQAAKAMGMSYKAAWDAINTMNNLAGEPLVARLVGGKGGGGTSLTSRGQQLVDNFKVIDQEHRRFIQQLGQQAAGLAEDYFLIRKLGMKTSARNQFQGKVTRITSGAVNDEIEMEVAGAQKIVATVTRESTSELALAVGVDAFALIKSSSIIVVTDDQGARFSARNRLTGTVGRLQTGAVNTEVEIYLPGGGTVSAIITNASSDSLALTLGMSACAIFKASSVIVGVPA